jgi:Tol biopolymer transport system component
VTSRIKVVGASGGGARVVATTVPDVARATWSPDGRFIAFTDVRAGVAGIYVVSSRGGSARRVLKGQFTEPSWGRAAR